MRRGEALVVSLGSILVGACWLWLVRRHGAAGDWQGVDEAVVDRFVAESGKTSPRPLVDWVRGDALLFAFLAAGLAAGFVLGFFARAAVRGPEKGQPS